MRRAGAILVALLLVGCGAGARRFALRPVVWVDDDQRPFAPAPPDRTVSPYWDATDHLIFRPLAQAPLLELARPAVDVNALDEVPDSSWFVNRMGRAPFSPDDVARGACPPGEEPPTGPLTVIAGTPGAPTSILELRAEGGQRYFLTIDREGRPEQATAASVIVSAVLHAAGYYVPCGRVIHFERGELVLGEGAQALSRTGSLRPMTEGDLDGLARDAARGPDGRPRGALSWRIEGRPLGPFSYTGTLAGDPNDVVPHEDRRELRALYLFAAWLDYWDVRQANTLATFIDAGEGRGHVRHYLHHFGAAMGLDEGNHRQGPRFGHTAYLDVGDVLLDVAAVGLIQRPWDHRTPSPVLRYFDAAHFDPGGWRPQYWNGALDRRTTHDLAWAARILARFSPAHVAALARLGRYSDPAVERRATEVLLGRREALLERHLTRLSPLADPTVRDNFVCMDDLMVSAGLRAPSSRRYGAALRRGEGVPAPLAPRVEGARVCVALPEIEGHGRAEDYLVLELSSETLGRDRQGLLRLHFYGIGSARLALVGLERLDP